MKRRALMATACIAVLGIAGANASTTMAADEWRFNVLLDGKQIGYHRFQLRDSGSQRELLSEARFNVKILFVSAYRYAHDAHEIWNEGCLARIDARTDDNGARRTVSGTQQSIGFRVAAGGTTADLDACVQTFAYWNPEILRAHHLLNPQTGEYVPVRIANIGVDTVTVHGATQDAEHYRIFGDATIGGKLRIDVWYSADRIWLALESITADGRLLRYQIQ